MVTMVTVGCMLLQGIAYENTQLGLHVIVSFAIFSTKIQYPCMASMNMAVYDPLHFKHPHPSIDQVFNLSSN